MERECRVGRGSSGWGCVARAVAGVPRVHAAGRHLAGVAAARVHAGRAPVAAAGVLSQLLRRAARARRAPAQRAPAAAALQLHRVRAEHPAVAQRLPEAQGGGARGGGRGGGGAGRGMRGRGRGRGRGSGRGGWSGRGGALVGAASDTYFRVGHRENYMHNRCFRRVIV